MPYQDSGGVWTVGYGHTGQNVGLYSSGITRPQAFALLASDSAALIAPMLAAGLLKNFNSYQFDAIASAVYNCGHEAVEKSDWFRLLQRYDFGAFAVWANWYCHDARGHFLPGLQNRRQAEVRLFAFGYYG